MTINSFFIAGTMQGSRQGSNQIEQSYRADITDVILRHYPDADIRCPLKVMEARLGEYEEGIRLSHSKLAKKDSLNVSDFDEPIIELTKTFHDLVNLSADSDVCIAYLPGHEASMGTSVEMFAAFRNGKTVITITDMLQNLAVMSCSTMVIRSIDDLDSALTSLQKNVN